MNESKESCQGKETKQSFEKELEILINRKSLENESNTPDFILARYMKSCLDTFNRAVRQREIWHGRD